MVGDSIGIVAPKPGNLVNLTLPDGQEDCDPLAVLSLEPDRDIGGRGVIASFVGSGCLALIIVTIYYFFVFDPKVTQFPDRQRTFSKRRTTTLSTQATVRWAAEDYVPPNPVDEYIYNVQVRLYGSVKWRPRWFPGKPKIEEAFRRCILGLSDLQILTGLCVLIAGFSAIETIPAYYWQLIVYVAWFSNLTHQCGLIFLRRYLHRKPWERGWRIVMITSLLILLIVATVPTMYFNWHTNGIYDILGPSASAAQPATPMRCFYNHETRHFMHEKTFGHPNKPLKFAATRAFQNVLISLIFLLSSYVTRVIKLFNSSSTFFRDQVRGKLGYQLRKFFGWILRMFDAMTRHTINPEPWFLLVESPILTIYFFFRVLLDIYASVLSDVGWLYGGTFIGLWRLIVEKQSETDFVDDGEDFAQEDRLMDFGQLLPLMLLASPIIATIGTFSHRSVSDAAIPSQRMRVVEGLENEDQQAKAIAEAGRNPDNVTTTTALQAPLLQDRKNRWNRLHFVLEDEKYWAAPWFPSALFTICMAELCIFLVVYINLIISYGVRTVFFQGLLAISSMLPLSSLPIQIGIAMRGWRPKIVARICWLVTVLIAGTNIWVCYRYAIAGDFNTMYASLGVAFGACFLMSALVCLLPKRLKWGRPVLQEEAIMGSVAELGEVSTAPPSQNSNSQETQETDRFSRSTTFKPEETPTFRLASNGRL